MHFFTLWNHDNSIINKYYEQYLGQLHSIISPLHISQTIFPSDFLGIPDIATTIEWYKNRKISEMKVREFLLKEWTFFSSYKPHEMFSAYWSLIHGTDIRLTMTDANPDNQNKNHPDHQESGVGIGWGTMPEPEWLSLYTRSFAILRDISPGLFHELTQMIKKIIPMGVSHRIHNSASYDSCIGHLYMSYPTGIDHPELAVLEAIIHESNHNKLNLVMKSDILILNTREEVYYSPYRPDTRHIHGIYLGLHALVAVLSVFITAHRTRVYMLPDTWLEKMIIYHMKNALSIKVLEKYRRFTPLGDTIFEEMQTVQRETNLHIQGLSVPQDTMLRARDAVRGHFSQVQTAYSNLRY